MWIKLAISQLNIDSSSSYRKTKSFVQKCRFFVLTDPSHVEALLVHHAHNGSGKHQPTQDSGRGGGQDTLESPRHAHSERLGEPSEANRDPAVVIFGDAQVDWWCYHLAHDGFDVISERDGIVYGLGKLFFQDGRHAQPCRVQSTACAVDLDRINRLHDDHGHFREHGSRRLRLFVHLGTGSIYRNDSFVCQVTQSRQHAVQSTNLCRLDGGKQSGVRPTTEAIHETNLSDNGVLWKGSIECG
mmetsp:Transcript_13858/g.22961  ORF Transcript_13858/g.22961 Transcript_13858/m.22961 type:complete len:243 (-) Transcript_13858:442-1170(-)